MSNCLRSRRAARCGTGAGRRGHLHTAGPARPAVLQAAVVHDPLMATLRGFRAVQNDYSTLYTQVEDPALRDRCVARERAQRRAEPSLSQERRVQPAGELSYGLEHGLEIAADPLDRRTGVLG